ncbi:hypothetical protein [Clostridium botulinum]|uniref:hypothetical protein n=1 Tax=Clostridium botulinum TaxID=1491 RepID=UPI001967D441|nr:hypothetical protein [Clostridium botulinum]MBN1050367.1 hypothetical protein [Clostridium botulinum]
MSNGLYIIPGIINILIVLSFITFFIVSLATIVKYIKKINATLEKINATLEKINATLEKKDEL